MTIHIPLWLCWTLALGVALPVVITVLFLAFIGWAFASNWSPPR